MGGHLREQRGTAGRLAAPGRAALRRAGNEIREVGPGQRASRQARLLVFFGCRSGGSHHAEAVPASQERKKDPLGEKPSGCCVRTPCSPPGDSKWLSPAGVYTPIETETRRDAIAGPDRDAGRRGAETARHRGRIASARPARAATCYAHHPVACTGSSAGIGARGAADVGAASPSITRRTSPASTHSYSSTGVHRAVEAVISRPSP
jgi:hypothetical protein